MSRVMRIYLKIISIKLHPSWGDGSLGFFEDGRPKKKKKKKCAAIWDQFLIYKLGEANRNEQLVIFGDHTTSSILGYWHDNVVCLSVYPFVYVCVTKWYILHQKCLNKWIVSVLLGTRFYNFFYNFQPLHRPCTLKVTNYYLLNHRRWRHLANKLFASFHLRSTFNALLVWLPCNLPTAVRSDFSAVAVILVNLELVSSRDKVKQTS